MFGNLFKRSAPTPPPAPPVRAEPRVGLKIDPTAAGALLAAQDLIAHNEKRGRLFKPATPLPGVVPPELGRAMAQDDDPGLLAKDDAFTDAFAWNVSGGLSGGLVTWLGYPYLAELAQRPEYRQMSETVAKEMTRRWIEIQSSGDEDKSDKIKVIEADLKKFKARERFRRAAELDGFFGRAHIYLDTGETDNRDELKQPLLLSKGKIGRNALKHLKVVEPTWTYPGVYNTTDPLARDYYVPRTWYVMGKEVHASRLLTLASREVPDLLKPAYSFGGVSLSQLAKPYIDNWLRTRQSVSDLVHSFSTMVLSTDMEQILQGGGAKDLADRADLFNITRDNRGLMMLDKTREQLENISTPLSSLDKLQAQAQEQMASVSHIPLVILLGITPSGLNASTDGEIRSFYSWIHAMQEHMFTQPLTTLIQVIQLARFGEIDPEIGFIFKDLWEASEKERAETKKIEADIDAVYAGLGALGPEDVRQKIADDPDLPYSNLDMSVPAPGSDPGFGADPDAKGAGGQSPKLGTGLTPQAAQTPAEAEGIQRSVSSAISAGDAEAGRRAVIPLAADADSQPIKRYQFDGLSVGIETLKGQVREGRTGAWAVKMPADYGYIMRSEGADGDRMDVFVGPYAPEQLAVFVVDQYRLDSSFDEHKVFIGFQQMADAIAAYDAGFPDGSAPERRKHVWQMPWADLRPWLNSLWSLSKGDAQYHITEGVDRCGVCCFFLGDKCQLVRGDIAANGWCKRFKLDADMAQDAEFDESKHPRADNGQFGSGSGGSSAAASSGANRPLTPEEKKRGLAALEAIQDRPHPWENDEPEDKRERVIHPTEAGMRRASDNVMRLGGATKTGPGWSTTEEVPISKINYTQPYVPKEGIKAYLENINSNPELPEVMHGILPGEYHVMSGHTRLSAQALAGRENIPVKVYHFSPEADSRGRHKQIKPPKKGKEST